MNKELIDKNIVWKGLNLELTKQELCEIFQSEYEKDNYYNFDLILDTFLKAYHKKIDFDYFLDWCILVSNVLYYTNHKSIKIKNLLSKISEFIDGVSFSEYYNQKELLYSMATLKDYNHKIDNLINKKNLPFTSQNIERILCFDHYNMTKESIVYRLLIVDNTKKEFDLKYIDDNDFEYKIDINYTFVQNGIFKKKFDFLCYNCDDWKENHNLIF